MKGRYSQFLFIAICHLSTFCFGQNEIGNKKVVSVILYSDKKILNPVLNSHESARLKVVALYSNGESRVIAADGLIYSTKNKFSSGEDQVLILRKEKKGDFTCQAFPKQGGIATVSVVANINGNSYPASIDLVVRPYYNDYHQTLVLKLFMGMEGEPVKRLENDPFFKKQHDILCTFAEALEVIKKTDNLTFGIPKIIYLVGWQKGGHDHLYPSWDSVNSKLKRPEDSTALQSLQWLIREAKRYHTTVSLHINMVDAYPSSPLWNEYLKKDVFGRDSNGVLIARDIQVKGDSMYMVSYTREWQEGLAQRRIDKLIAMIPELKEGHTIHIDAFLDKLENGTTLSPWHAKPENGGIDIYREAQTQWKIFNYWRERGFDVTGEGIFWAHPPGEGFYGLQPMSWWYPDDTEYQMNIPEYLSARGSNDREGDGDFRFGNSMHGEDIYKKDIEHLTGFQEEFCRTTLPWYWLSRSDRIAFEGDTLFYSNGTIAYSINGHKIIRQGKFKLRDNNDLFVPALWKKNSIIAYSETGYKTKSWYIPENWSGVRKVKIFRITINGLEPKPYQKVENGQLLLSLDSHEAILINPY